MELKEAKQYLNSKGYILVEEYDANRERTYKKHGAETPEQKAKIDNRLKWLSHRENINYLEDKYEKENIRNRKSAVPVADAMIDYINKNYKDVDIWSYDDGYYNPVTGDHNPPKNNYNTITFHCGPDIGRKWCIYWYIKPDKQPVEISEVDKKFLTWDRHYQRYTGKFKVEAFIDKEHKYIEILNEDEIFDMIDKAFAKAIELKETK